MNANHLANWRSGSDSRGRPPAIGALRGIAACALVACAAIAAAPTLMGQSAEVPIDAETIRALEQPQTDADAPTPTIDADAPSGIDLLTLIGRGGRLMYPILFMSVLVVTLAVERLVTLRRRRVIPPRLVSDLARLRDPVESFDPDAAMRVCRKYPSPAARVIGAMLLRTGQPLGEVERAASETVQREADDHAAPIRWLTLAAAATPLMGLLGTVWGMILAFHESTTLTPDRSRSEQLSEGIYTALVTTLAGLAVAIPAAILAQFLENRLAKLFHRIEELAFAVAPGLERFVGRQRLDPERGLKPISGRGGPAPPPPPPASPPASPPAARTPIKEGRTEKVDEPEKAVRSS